MSERNSWHHGLIPSWLFCILAFLIVVVTAPAQIKVPVVERAGKLYAATDDLEKAAIAIKKLPGQDSRVACYADRCVLIDDHLEEAGRGWINIDELASKLGAVVRRTAQGNVAQLDLKDAAEREDDGVYRVGELAPDFRLRRLDGSEIALSDLRGKRVVINSWASW